MVSVAVGIGSAISVALAIAIVDIYLTGHGSRGLRDEWITWSAAGVHLSVGDVIMLVVALLATVFAWTISGQEA